MYVWGMKSLKILNQKIQRISIFQLEKSWNIEPNETKSQYLIFFFSYLWCGILEYFNFFLYRMRHLIKPHAFPIERTIPPYLLFMIGPFDAKLK